MANKAEAKAKAKKKRLVYHDGVCGSGYFEAEGEKSPTAFVLESVVRDFSLLYRCS